jgi:hypothetical protein
LASAIGTAKDGFIGRSAEHPAATVQTIMTAPIRIR